MQRPLLSTSEHIRAPSCFCGQATDGHVSLYLAQCAAVSGDLLHTYLADSHHGGVATAGVMLDGVLVADVSARPQQVTHGVVVDLHKGGLHVVFPLLLLQLGGHLQDLGQSRWVVGGLRATGS